jgi:hypothetical protein
VILLSVTPRNAYWAIENCKILSKKLWRTLRVRHSFFGFD